MAMPIKCDGCQIVNETVRYCCPPDGSNGEVAQLCPDCWNAELAQMEMDAAERDLPSDEALNLMMALVDMWPDPERPEPPYIGKKPPYAPR